MFATKPQLLTLRQIRWQELFATYWFEIVYIPGKKNGKADALSRVETEKTEGKEFDKDSLLKPDQLVGFDDVDGEASYLDLATNFVDDIKQAYRQDKMAQEIIKDLAEDTRNNYNKKHWLKVDGLLVRKENPEQVYVPTTFRNTIIQLNHDLEYAGHLGIDKTSDLVSRNFYWPKMRKDISGYVKACKTFATKKNDRHKEYSTAVRVPVAELPWQEVQLDFLTDLPVKCRTRTEDGYVWETKRAGCILVCCDRLTKMIHLIGFKHVPNANETANAFLREAYGLHGFPKVVTTDLGVQFTIQVWKELLEFFGTEVRYATTSHHETVGQVERNNAYIETYLRCFVGTYDDESWMDSSFLAEFCYNNSIHASTQQFPFLTLYNYQIHNSPKTANLVHSLGEAKMIDSYAHNLGNLNHILKIAQTRYLDNMDKTRTDKYPRYCKNKKNEIKIKFEITFN